MIHKENEEDMLPVVLGGWQHVLFLRYLEKRKAGEKERSEKHVEKKIKNVVDKVMSVLYNKLCV